MKKKDGAKPKTRMITKKLKGSSQSFYIEDVVFELLSQDADDEERSRSYFVNKILKAYYVKQGRLVVEPKKKPPRKILKG